VCVCVCVCVNECFCTDPGAMSERAMRGRAMREGAMRERVLEWILRYAAISGLIPAQFAPRKDGCSFCSASDKDPDAHSMRQCDFCPRWVCETCDDHSKKNRKAQKKDKKPLPLLKCRFCVGEKLVHEEN